MSLTATDKVQATEILRDTSDSAGKTWDLVAEGDAVASRNKAAAVIAKRADGSARMPKVNDNDELIISSESDDLACIHDSAKVAGSTVSEQTILTIALTNSATYRDIALWCSNARRTEYRVVWIEDTVGAATEHELGAVLLNANSAAFAGLLPCAEFSVPATLAHELRVVGMNQDAASDLRAAISARELT